MKEKTQIHKLVGLAGIVASASLTNAAIVTVPDSTGNTTNFTVTNSVANITGEDSLYFVSTMTISNPNGYLSGNLYLETATSPITLGGFGLGMGNVVNNDVWGINGAPGNTPSTVTVAEGVATTLVSKIDQVTGDWSYWINPDLGQPEPATSDLSGTTANLTDGIDAVIFRGGRYGSIPVNTNVTDFTNVALYTGANTPFAAIPEPSSLLLLGLGGIGLLRRRR